MLMRFGLISVSSTCLLVLAAGCGEERVTKAGGSKAAQAEPPIKARETIGKRTQEVLRLDEALQQGAVLADTTIPVADPLTQNAAAYRTTVGKLGGMAVDQAIQLRNAQSIQDPKPLTYDEFMNEIIKKGQPDGIMLAMLPYYQEYAWDEQNQKLVVVEFPERKAKMQEQMDRELGRK
jgi:hypothetical protein